MSWIDWLIMLSSVIILRHFSLGSRKYMRGVADFLAANRLAGRYLLTIAAPMSMFGTASIIGIYEMHAVGGFSIIWWAPISMAASTIVLLAGWIYYRFRETRAMTLAQFFEMRYNRRFRIFAACVSFITGMIGFGIVPAVMARFFMCFFGLPDWFHIVPGLEIMLPTFPVVMAIDMILAMTFVTMGGQISVMITDCIQGIYVGIAIFVVVAAIFIIFGWNNIVQGMQMAPPNESMLNAFRTSHVRDFNMWFVFINIFALLYCYMGSHGQQGFYSAAKTAHEQKMGAILGMLRGLPLVLLQIIPPIAMIALMRLPEFATQTAQVDQTLATIGNDAVRGQMTVPVALAVFLPVGIKGLLATTMVFFSITSTDSTMHSRASMLIQDIYLPITRKTLTPAQHIKLLRYSVVGVALFGFLFSLVYPQTQKLMMYGATVGTIWMAGSGAAIAGGLYWRKGTVTAAYAAMILGAVIGAGGLGLHTYYQHHLHRAFPINGQWIMFIGMITAVVTYIVVSLLTCRKGKEFNLAKMLHRGDYAIDSEQGEKPKKISKLALITGITSEFSRGDKVVVICTNSWVLVQVLAFIVFTTIQLTGGLPEGFWVRYWHIYVMAHFVVGIPVTIWISIGGILDLRSLYKNLLTAKQDDTDDGRVLDTESADIEESTDEGVEVAP